MTISFNEINTNLRSPGVYLEVDNSRASSGLGSRQRLLLIGFSALAATGISQVFSGAEANSKYGAQSQLAQMVAKALPVAGGSVDVFAAPVIAPAAGIAAKSIVTVTAANAEAGTVSMSVAGVSISASVRKGATATVIAGALADAVNSVIGLPVAATKNTNKVELEAIHKGSYGNRLYVAQETGYGKEMPTGVSLAIGDFAGGTGGADLSAVITAMGDDQYHYIGCAFNDQLSRTALHDEMARRYAANLMAGGRVCLALADTVANLQAYALTQNTPHLSTLDAGTLQQPESDVAAAYAARAAWRLSKDPARPLQHQELFAMSARAQQRLATERESLLHSGIATIEVVAGRAQVHRAITMYRVNSTGTADDSYLDVTTLSTLDAVRAYQRDTLLLRYPDFKAADSATTAPVGQPILTAPALKGEFYSLYQDMISFGWVEDADSYLESLVVESDPKIAGRFNVLDNPNLITPLRIIAVRSQFELVEQRA